MKESILIFGGKNLKDIKDEEGIGWWRINKERAEKLEYAIITRCLTQDWANHDVEKGTALMICKLNGNVDKDSDSSRLRLDIDFYAELNIPNVWQKITGSQRYPCAYRNTETLLKALNLDINTLEWIPFK